MLRGHVFKSQTFANEIFAIFIDTFLDGKMGIIKGCELSNTNNTATIGEGIFCIKGRFLDIIGNETINISANGYYSLVCEIDLSKENTKEHFNQGSIKVISETSTYPTLIQQDLNNGETLYQYEFARFRKTDNEITDFTDRRTYLNFGSIYGKINSDANALINLLQQNGQLLIDSLEQEIQNVRDESAFILKTIIVTDSNVDINNYVVEGRYFFGSDVTFINAPNGIVNGFLDVYEARAFIKQTWHRGGTINSNDYDTFIRTQINSKWSDWQKFTTHKDLETKLKSKQNSVLSGTATPSNSLGNNGDIYFQYE